MNENKGTPFVHAEALKRAIKDVTERGDRALLTVGMTVWQQDDAAWFEKNPRRSFRVRKIHVGETHVTWKNCTHILVRQIEPGFRDKMPVFAFGRWRLLGDDELMHKWQELTEQRKGSAENHPKERKKTPDVVADMMTYRREKQ